MALLNNKKPKEKEDKKLNLTVCIITKDDAELIEDCIKSVQDIAREIIVVDLGSTDNTVDIVRNYTNRIYWHKWNNDYAEIRNFFAKYVSSDWVMHMDAYERLSPDSKKFFTDKLLDKKNIAYICKTIFMYQDKETENFSCRIFRRNSEIKFRHTLDTSADSDIQKIGRKENLDIVATDITFDRYLYLKYFDESELHEQRIELAKHGLEDKKLDPALRTYYKLCLGLSLNFLGEEDDAEEIVKEVLADIRENIDKKTIYYTPTFMQAYLFFAFKSSKKKNYEEGFEIIKEGLEIYHDSLTMMIRYSEFLFVMNRFQECFDYLQKVKEMLRNENYYMMEPLDIHMIGKIGGKLERLCKEQLSQTANTESLI